MGIASSFFQVPVVSIILFLLTFTLWSEESFSTLLTPFASIIGLAKANTIILLVTDLLSGTLLITTAQCTHKRFFILINIGIRKVSILAFIALEARIALTTHALATKRITV